MFLVTEEYFILMDIMMIRVNGLMTMIFQQARFIQDNLKMDYFQEMEYFIINFVIYLKLILYKQGKYLDGLRIEGSIYFNNRDSFKVIF